MDNISEIYKNEAFLLVNIYEGKFKDSKVLSVVIAGSTGLGTNIVGSDRDYYVIVDRELSIFDQAMYRYEVHNITEENLIDVQILSFPLSQYCHIVPNLISESKLVYGVDCTSNLKEPDLICYRELCKNKTLFQIKTFKGLNNLAYPEIILKEKRPLKYGYAKSINLFCSCVTWMTRTILGYQYNIITYTKLETIEKSSKIVDYSSYIKDVYVFSKYHLHYMFPENKDDINKLMKLYTEFNDFYKYFEYVVSINE